MSNSDTTCCCRVLLVAAEFAFVIICGFFFIKFFFLFDWATTALLPLHTSQIAGNRIMAKGCIAFSSSLVHLSHLEVLNFGSKCVGYSVLLSSYCSGLLKLRLFLSRECFICGFLINFEFVFGFDWGRLRPFSLSIPHTLQPTASRTKAASRFRHLWFISLL